MLIKCPLNCLRGDGGGLDFLKGQCYLNDIEHG